MTTPTGVFVRLPLSEDQAHVFLKESSHAWDEFNGASDAIACEAGLIAIGTRVTGSDVKAVCSIDEDILRNIRDLDKDDEEYVTDMVFRPGYDGTVDLVRQSDHLAALASLQAEVGRLREENERLNRKIRPQFFCSDILEESSMDTREDIVAEARKYDDDLQAFTIFEMEGYAKVHKSYGFYDQSNKCHWFDTEAEALSAAAALKGPEA